METNTTTDRYIHALEEAGFDPSVQSTGGGCWALMVKVGNADIVITDPYGETVPTDADACMVGLWLEGEQVSWRSGSLSGICGAVAELTSTADV